MRKLQYQFPGHIVPASQLAPHEFLALYWYMAINGEAWTPSKQIAACLERNGIFSIQGCQNIRRCLRNHLPSLLELHGSYLIGRTEIPLKVLKETIFKESPDIRGDFHSFEAYHQWYLSMGDTPAYNRKDPWPVILSNFKNETLEDGWHRFHRYVQTGLDPIPALYYPKTPSKTKL